MPETNVKVWVHNDFENHLLQLSWELGSYPRGKYNVDKGLINQRANEARSALQDMVDGWRKGDTSEYPVLLRAVAMAGYELYKALFFANEEPDRSAGEEVKGWMAKTVIAHTYTVTFKVPAAVHVPWGLIYENADVEDETIAIDVDGFWCMKYDLCTHYGPVRAEGVEIVWQPDQFTLLFGAHQNVWTSAHHLLTEQDRVYLDGLLGPLTQPKFSLGDLKGAWQQRRDGGPYSLLCLYCHASGKELCIGPETISYSVFAQAFARGRAGTTPPTLVFLAGCETAVGDLDLGFLGATGGKGFCGFIGTEVKVPDVFTLGFLSCFLDRFYSGGCSVADVLRELRTEHWPLSLVFSMCCAGDLSVAPRLAPAVVERVARNLSDGRIASK